MECGRYLSTMNGEKKTISLMYIYTAININVIHMYKAAVFSCRIFAMLIEF